MMVKICGITRREDALAAVDAGASAIGFVFYFQSPRYISPERAAEIGEGLPVWKVGVFVDESPASIETLVRAAHLDVVQVYGGFAPKNTRVWHAFRIAESFDKAPGGEAEAVLLDGMQNGKSFDWRIAREAAPKVIIAGGLDSSNVGDAIRAAAPWGVDASSRLESAPGIKDHGKVHAFVKAAREAV